MGHFIVCGFGHLGQSVVQLLRGLDERVVVITEEIRRSASVRLDDTGLRMIQGDARERAALDAAGLANARAVIAATDDDLTNIEIALDVAKLAPGTPVVVRLFDQNLATMLERSFPIRKALAMSAIAAPIFASAALDDPLFAQLQLGDTAYRISAAHVAGLAGATAGLAAFRLGLRPDSHEAVFTPESVWRHLSGSPSLSSSARRMPRNLTAAVRWPVAMWRHAPLPMRLTFGMLVVLTGVSVLVFSSGLHLRLIDALYFMVTTLTTTGYGDITPRDAGPLLKLYVCFVMLLGSASTALFYSFLTDFIVAERFRRIVQNPDIAERNHVIVVGLGNVGYRVVEALRRFGIPTVGIDVDPTAPFVAELRPQTPVLTGDGRLAGTLQRAGIARARSLIAATGNDAINLEIALAAKQQSTRVRIVSRLFDPAFATKVEGVLPIERALSASRVAAPSFVASALFPNVIAAFVHGAAFVVITHENAPATWDGCLASEIDEGHRVQLAFAEVGRDHVAVGPQTRVAAGRRYVVVRQRYLVPTSGAAP